MTKEEPQTKYLMKIAYDGSCFYGWQIQANHTTVQQTLQEILSKILGEEIFLSGSGRTDTGVHALEQVAHFTISKERVIDPYRFLWSVNKLLPPSIRVLKISPTLLDFHARYSAIKKTYCYHLYIDSVLDPFKRNFNLHIPQKFDLSALKIAAKYFIGTHNFLSFANSANEGSAKNNPIKTLYELLVEESKDRKQVTLQLTADGFLYKMVRNIVGHLVEVGKGKRDPHEIPSIFKKEDRHFAAKTAPPHGLFLKEVFYPNKFYLQK